jgi:hypothetical protein
LRRLLRAVTRLAGDDDRDWDPETPWPALQLILSARTDRVLYVTKLQGLLGLDLDDAVSRVTIISRYGVPSQRYVSCVARACPRGAIHFVGDLDPLDLTVFLSLAGRLARLGREAKYLGVDSAWVRLCREHASRGDYVPTIRMSAFEVEHYNILKATRVDWDAVLGVEAVDLLNRGFKLELEGATNPEAYSGRFSAKLAGSLFKPRRG